MPTDAVESLGLRWLPDETSFSLCSRYHVLSGHSRAATTCATLFGHPRYGLAHDFPTRLSYFCRRTGGLLGTPSQILNEHSIAPVFVAIGDERRRHAVEAAANGDGIGALKMSLGLLSGRLRANHPMRYCVTCIQCDREAFGTAYWHVQHQLPAAIVCLLHGEFLHISTRKANRWERFSWALPSPEHEVAPAVVVCTRLAHARGVTLSNIALNLWRQRRDSALPGDRVAAVYARGVSKRGMARGKQQNNRMAIGEGLADFAASLAPLPNAAALALPESVSDAAAYALRMIYPPRGASHPSRHALMIAWLFGGWSEFIEEYKATANDPEDSKGTTREPKSGLRRDAFLDAVIKRGVAPSTAARSLGVDPATGQHWLLKAGVTSTGRRPSVLLPKRRASAISMLRAGKDKAEVAAAHELATVSVTRLMRTEPGLQAAWHQARYDQIQQRYRAEWSSVIAENPGASRTLLRALTEAAYGWLYRNDRAWLLASQESVTRAPRSGGQYACWDERDRAFADALDRCAEHFAKAAPRRPTLRSICEYVPGLQPKIRRLDALPLTSARLAMMLRGRRRHAFDDTSQHDFEKDGNDG